MKRVIVGTVLSGLLLVGCGDGNGEAEQAQAQAQANVDRFCELVEQYNKGTGFVPPPDDTPPEEQDAALTQALRDYLSLPEVEAIFDELGEVAPPEVDEAVDVMRERSAELVETGENGFNEPDAIAANDQIKTYTETACAPEESASPDGAEGEASEASPESSPAG